MKDYFDEIEITVIYMNDTEVVCGSNQGCTTEFACGDDTSACPFFFI